MKINAMHVRPGMVVEHEGKLCRVTRADQVTPGRRMAVAHLQMKDIKTGIKYEPRFNSGMEVERITLESKSMNYLYNDGVNYTFMDNVNYDQANISADMLGDQAQWLAEGMTVDVEFYQDSPVSVTLPAKVEGEVETTDAVVKGQTASASFKPAKLTNGVTVMVPAYVTAGERILVSTFDNSFAGRSNG